MANSDQSLALRSVDSIMNKLKTFVGSEEQVTILLKSTAKQLSHKVCILMAILLR